MQTFQNPEPTRDEIELTEQLTLLSDLPEDSDLRDEIAQDLFVRHGL